MQSGPRTLKFIHEWIQLELQGKNFKQLKEWQQIREIGIRRNLTWKSLKTGIIIV